MDKLKITAPTNGIPFNWEDLQYFLGQSSYNKGIYQALNNILSAVGSNFIVFGCNKTGVNEITSGWVMLDSELIAVDQHAATGDYFEKITGNYNTDGDKQTQLGGAVQIYEQIRATSTAASGNLINPYAGEPLKYQDLLNKKSNYLEHDIGDGDLNIDNETGIIKFIIDGSSGDINVNLPDATNPYNKGKIIWFILDNVATPAAEEINIRYNVTTLVNRYLADGWKEFIAIKSDGSDWYVVKENVIGNIIYPGVYPQATSSQRTAATPNKAIMADHHATTNVPGITELSTEEELNNATPNKVVTSDLYLKGFELNTLNISGTLEEGNSPFSQISVINQDVKYSRVGNYFNVDGYFSTNLINSGNAFITMDIIGLKGFINGSDGDYRGVCNFVIESTSDGEVGHCEIRNNETKIRFYIHNGSTITDTFDVGIYFSIKFKFD